MNHGCTKQQNWGLSDFCQWITSNLVVRVLACGVAFKWSNCFKRNQYFKQSIREISLKFISFAILSWRVHSNQTIWPQNLLSRTFPQLNSPLSFLLVYPVHLGLWEHSFQRFKGTLGYTKSKVIVQMYSRLQFAINSWSDRTLKTYHSLSLIGYIFSLRKSPFLTLYNLLP